MRVQVRKCRVTGKLFEDKDLKKYAIHLKNLRADRAEKLHLARIRDTFSNWLKEEKEVILFPEDIPEWFLKNQRKIMDAVSAGLLPDASKPVMYDKRFFKTDIFTELNFEKPVYKASVSNSHVCPHNGVENWSRETDKPMGYPGWTTYVRGTLDRNKKHIHNCPVTSALNMVGLRTGSGGGGCERWGYGVSIFLADWPGLKEAVDNMERDLIIRRLQGKS